jgi:hypothetical protein
MGVRVPEGYGEIAFRTAITGDAEEMLCTLGFDFQQLENVSQGGVEAIANAWQSTIVPRQTSEATFKGVFVALGPDGLGLRFQVDRNVLGGVAAAPVPPNTAVLAQKKTAVGGRRNRGRMYIPGIPEGMVSGAGFIDLATHALWATAVTNLRAEVAALSFVGECVIFHTTAPGLPGLTPTAISSMSVSTKVATQRRRLR